MPQAGREGPIEDDNSKGGAAVEQEHARCDGGMADLGRQTCQGETCQGVERELGAQRAGRWWKDERFSPA